MDIVNHINKIKKENSKIHERNLPIDMLLNCHKILNECFRDLSKTLIIKGSRALNKNLDKDSKIYNEEDILYIDYDIYSSQSKNDIMYISKKI